MIRYALALSLMTTACAHGPHSCRSGTNLRQEFGFTLPRLPVHHQREDHQLDIDVRYQYADGLAPENAPDFVPVAKEVTGFMTNYQPDGDYWEVMNKKLADRILAEQPTLEEVTITIAVDPSATDPYHRFSRVTRSRQPCLRYDP